MAILGSTSEPGTSTIPIEQLRNPNMKARLRPLPTRGKIDHESGHIWSSAIDEFGIGTDVEVFGVSKRKGRCYLLLIPYPEVLGDVFFVRTECWEVLDGALPDTWNTDFTAFSELLHPSVDNFELIADPLFLSTRDFIWRLSEEQLNASERNGVRTIVRMAHAANSTNS